MSKHAEEKAYPNTTLQLPCLSDFQSHYKYNKYTVRFPTAQIKKRHVVRFCIKSTESLPTYPQLPGPSSTKWWKKFITINTSSGIKVISRNSCSALSDPCDL